MRIRNSIQKADFCKQMHTSLPSMSVLVELIFHILCTLHGAHIGGIRMHVVLFPQLCDIIIMDRFRYVLSICGESGPISCMGVLSSSNTAVTQNHITTSFNVQPKTQQASGYNTYTSCFSVNARLYMLLNLSISLPLATSSLFFSFFLFSHLTKW